MEERLVSLEHPLGVAAIVAGPEGPALAGDLAQPDRTALEDRPSWQWLSDDLSALGGLLPPGAVTAEVADVTGRVHRAVTGRDAWLVVVPQPYGGGHVRYANEHGDLVPVPMPDGVEVEPVPDADEPCPACGAASWQRIVAAPPGRYGEDGAGRPTAARCAHCGHTEGLWVLYAPLGGESVPDQEEVAARLAAARAEAARFPEPGVPRYRVTGADAEAVSEDLPRPLPEMARRALEPVLMNRDATGPPQRSPTAILLWMNGRERDAAATAARAPVSTVPVPVDGEPVPFTTVADGEAFAAVARLAGTTVIVAGRGDPRALALETER